VTEPRLTWHHDPNGKYSDANTQDGLKAVVKWSPGPDDTKPWVWLVKELEDTNDLSCISSDRAASKEEAMAAADQAADRVREAAIPVEPGSQWWWYHDPDGKYSNTRARGGPGAVVEWSPSPDDTRPWVWYYAEWIGETGWHFRWPPALSNQEDPDPEKRYSGRAATKKEAMAAADAANPTPEEYVTTVDDYIVSWCAQDKNRRLTTEQWERLADELDAALNPRLDENYESTCDCDQDGHDGHTRTIQILGDMGLAWDQIEEIVTDLNDRGGRCDCEVRWGILPISFRTD
jgi:hypothetical protein